MAVYLLYLVLTGAQLWFCTSKGYLSSKKGKMIYVSICCAELVILAAMRGHTVGADTKLYLDAVEYYAALPKKEILFAKRVWPYDFEFGYFMLTKLCALVNLPKSLFLLVVALLIYIPVFSSIYRYSKVPYISILAYFAMGFFSYSLGVFRQMIAVSIVLCGVKYIGRRQFWRYAAVVAVAMLFHTTAIATIAIYPVARIPLKKYAKWIIPGELVCLLLGRPIAMAMFKLFPKYAGYINGQYDVQGGTYLMLLLLNVLLFALIYLNSRGFTKSRMTIAALSLAVIIQAVGYSMALLGRAVIYFSYFTIFAFAEIAYILMNKPKVYETAENDVIALWSKGAALMKRMKLSGKVLLWILFVGALALLVLKDLWGNKYVLPYTFFFQN